jgi:hypothetical protein
MFNMNLMRRCGSPWYCYMVSDVHGVMLSYAAVQSLLEPIGTMKFFVVLMCIFKDHAFFQHKIICPCTVGNTSDTDRVTAARPRTTHNQHTASSHRHDQGTSLHHIHTSPQPATTSTHDTETPRNHTQTPCASLHTHNTITDVELAAAEIDTTHSNPT